MKKLILFIIPILTGCMSVIDETQMEIPSVFPENFDYKTTHEYQVILEAKDGKDIPLTGIAFQVYSRYQNQSTYLSTVQTADDGLASFKYPVGIHIDSLEIRTNYIGLPNSKLIGINGGSPQIVTFGGSTQKSGRKNSSSARSRSSSGSLFEIGSYDSQGVPFYLEPVDDYISQDLLDLVNNSLPEQYPVPTYNPQYLDENLVGDTRLQDSAQVWITFVHEGAGYRNALGYYSYNLDNPPATIDDIDSLKIIFPNLSYTGSGGGISSGNKVSLGQFPPNTGIGWFLIPNGWNGSSVSTKSDTKYSNKDFNTFTSAEYRTHTVLLLDQARQIQLLGMEDLSRPGGDQDFNDAVFYVTANPYSALIIDNLETTQTDTTNDTDGDGVSDANDDYPDDPDKAFDIYTPGENVFGSIAFEDLWPANGDFDLNDMVIDYNFQSIADVAQNIVELRVKYKLRAMGALYNNGFGFSLPIEPSKIASITGQDVVQNSSIVLSGNGTEVGQDKAVILVFENGFRVWPGTYEQTNTISGKGYYEPVEFDLVIKFSEPIPSSTIGYPPFNPFIFRTENRGLEVHLAGQEPTSLADESLFGTEDDRTDNSTVYYKNGDNLPFAFYLPTSFEYPEEYESVRDAFLKFEYWVQSEGTTYDDWFQTNNPEYRDNNKIYE